MKRRLRKQLPALLGMGSVLTACIVGLGYMGVQAYGKVTADAYGCYADAPQRQTFVLFDTSEPRFNEEQARSLRSYFDRLYDGLSFNERLSVFTSEGDQIASVARPRFSLCGQAVAPEELVAAGAVAAEKGYLRKARQRLHQQVLAPELDTLLARDVPESRAQNHQSPILEMIADISRRPDLRPGSRLIVISDLLQNSDTARFCSRRGDMPRFAVFAKRPVFERVRPRALAGVDVEVLMLQRYGYGQPGIAYCRDEEELRAFWRDYFVGAGAGAPNFVRIRMGLTRG